MDRHYAAPGTSTGGRFRRWFGVVDGLSVADRWPAYRRLVAARADLASWIVTTETWSVASSYR
jgi:hypothetical protein